MTNEWLACRRWPQLGGAGDKGFVHEGAALLVTGRGASARMAALVEQVEAAVKEGVSGRDMLVVCADFSSASQVRGRLRASEALGDASVEVVTSRELACSVMGDPRAAQAVGLVFSGGRPRLLCAYEADFVVEDVKTLGTRPKRLRELLKFLYRGWTELSDEDPEWLFTAEEVSTFEFLADELAYLGVLMEPQLSNLATKALRLDGSLREDVGRHRLFVLDYQNLSRASQLLCQLVATGALTVVADDEGHAEVCESYPYPQGIEEFGRLNPAARFAALGNKAGASRDARACELVWETPADEIAGVADAIAEAVAQGGEPSDIAVMALHPWWARKMGRALEKRGVPANAWYAPLSLRGDIRDFGRCLVPRVVTLLRLLADPQDAMAWRSWFGFGDYLTRSNQFAEMRKEEVAGGRREGIRGGLEAYGHDFGDVDQLLGDARELRGPELLGHLVEALGGQGATVPPVFTPLSALGPDADASQMVAELDRLQFFDGIPERMGVVVSSREALASLDFSQAYVIGLVNGIFPKAAFFDLTKVSISQQEKMRVRDEHAAHAMAMLGREELFASHFRYAEREFAERVGLKQARIFVSDDGKTLLSEAEPSLYTNALLRQTGEPGEDF